MTQEHKTPEEPHIFAEFKGAAKDGLKMAKEEIDHGIDGAMRAAHTGIGYAKDGYHLVEGVVGRDRLLGAGLSAKGIALLLVKKPPALLLAHPVAAVVVGVATAVGGAAVAPWVVKRYKAANGLDKSNDNDAAAAPPAPEGP